MKKFLISLISAIILISTACYYQLGFYLADWDMHSVIENSWIILLVISIIPLALIKNKQWNWLIFYLVVYVLYFVSMHFDAERQILERVSIVDTQYHGELFFMLNSVKFLI